MRIPKRATSPIVFPWEWKCFAWVGGQRQSTARITGAQALYLFCKHEAHVITSNLLAVICPCGWV